MYLCFPRKHTLNVRDNYFTLFFSINKKSYCSKCYFFHLFVNIELETK